MIQIWVALIILIFSMGVTKITEGFEQEGFEEEDMNSIMSALAIARKDKRMRPDQVFAIENALRYAQYIKTGFIKFRSCREEAYLFGKGHECTHQFP